MNSKTIKPIVETKYLSVDNAWRYRSIMRSFYIFDSQFRHWLSKEDIFETLKRNEEFQSYSIELCRQDLDSLVEWGNLSAVQDTTKVTTYAQFINKQFRYQMTEYSIEIERMTIRLENIFIEGGSLEQTLLERIKDELRSIKGRLGEEDKTVGGWWRQLSADFQRLNQNYQDYIRDWYSAKAEELMKTKSFLLYKEKLVDYLRNFIRGLQLHAYEIEGILRLVSMEDSSELVDKISRYEYDIPRIDMEAVKYEDIRENIQGKFTSLKQFFLGNGTSESEVEKILSMTNEIIRRITRYAANILEMSNQYSNRKDEYKKIAEMFLSLEELREAHILSSHVFGIGGYKHFKGNLIRDTESIHSSIWEEEPLKINLDLRVRNYHEKIQKTGIKDNSEEKQRMRERVLRERELQRDILSSYTVTGKIDFKHLKNVPQEVRSTLLRWLGKGIREAGQVTVTEHGQKFKLLNPEETERCTLLCEDGELEMPAYILEFEV